ncbi:hypothetical protein EI94DRAFT_1705251 [Lactarius quietus]|nr:hypothetical protein EI94DRAFT_1705251 [Lactarius quietus]
MCQFLLGLIVDLPLPGRQAASHILRAVHVLLDFVHLAQYPSHTTQTLNHLEECLKCFDKNNAVFVNLGVHTQLNIPKFHSLLHYHQSITLFSSTDNYKTEQLECLHIDLTTNEFHVTNKKDEYYQMTVWVEQHEKIHRHSAFINWQQQDHPTDPPTSIPIEPLQIPPQYLKMAKNLTAKATFGELATKYSMIDFQDALANFITSMNYLGASGAALCNHAANTLIPFQLVPVFQRFKYTSSCNLEDSDIIDCMMAWLEQSSVATAQLNWLSQPSQAVLSRAKQINWLMTKTGPAMAHKLAELAEPSHNLVTTNWAGG